jgi:cell division protein FtsI (penicillin-binding protein 3)
VTTRRTQRPPDRTLRGSAHLRLRAALLVITMVLSLFGARLFQLQGLDPQAYAARAEADGLVKLDLPAERGDIVDRNGALLAQSVAGLMVVADPKVTGPHAEAIARILADRLGLDYFDVLLRLRKPDTRFQYVARRVPASQATAAVAAVEKAGFHGLDTRNDPVRDYPADDVAANLVGFLGQQTDAQGHPLPAAGLEKSFNRLLSGKDGHDTYEVGGGNRIPLGENTEVKPVNGKQLTLTLDRDAQWYAQRVLAQAVHNSRAESGAAIALDSRTGQVLALADYPTFDANRGSKASEKEWGSRALSDVYEPGSVEKVLTASALIQAGKVSPRTRIVVPHQLPVADRVIHDYFQHGRLHLTLAGVIAKSSNIGTVLASRTVGNEVLGRYLKAFGLGERTGVGLAGETRGLLPDPSTWSPLTHATISFGQGVSVNALQMAAAVNTIANKGEYVSPSLVLGRATTDGGRVVGSDTATTRRVISAETAAKVARMMEMVVTEGAGTAPGAGIAGYRVAGKTGTAQEVGAKCRCYDGSLAVSFAGFAPADNPRFTVYVVIQRPHGSASGGGTAGPVFRKILSYLLQKYAVPPTDTPPAHLPVTW